MNEIVYVSPQLYLVSDSRWKSQFEKPGYVPILRADVYKFQESLNGILSARSDLSSIRGSGNLNDLSQNQNHQDSGSTNSGDEDSRSVNGSVKYQSLKQFLPISLEQQLHTISLVGIPAKMAVHDLENFFCRCAQLILKNLDAAQEPDILQCWSNIQFLETQDIFIRLREGHTSFAKFVKLMKEWFESEEGPSAELHIDSNTIQFIEDQIVGDITLSKELTESLNRLWQQLDQSPPDKTHDQDVNVEYQVDLNTLSDLPQDSLGQLCQDIVGFRTKVVTIEREKRVREAYEESKRRRQQMMKIFDQIRKSRRDARVRREEQDEEAEEDGEGEEEDEEEDNEEDEEDGEDDFLLEQRRLEREKQESENRYQALLKQLQTKIEPRLSSLQERIYRAANCDQIRAEEQTMYLKELLHLAADPYYDHHRSYKEQEENRDEVDRKEHPCTEAQTLRVDERQTAELDAQANVEQQQQQPVVLHNDSQGNEQFKIKFAFKKAIDNSVATHSSSEHEEQEQAPIHEGAPDVLREENLDAKLQRLKDSNLVQELVKEYLGVYEQELVDYIFETIREKRNKLALLAELRETFDDDAVTIVEKIWSSEELNTT